MTAERLASIFETMALRERSQHAHGSLCSVASEVVDVKGAGIILAKDALVMTEFCSSNPFARSLIDLEIAVGEGPCSESVAARATSSESDLTSTPASRWMFFTPEAFALGARAVFGFPLRIGAIRLGALCLYSDRIGDLSDDQSADALLMASVVGRGVVALQAGAAPDTLSEALKNEATFDFSVHQAAGMIAVQGAVDISTALILLRTRAFSVCERLNDVATQIIERQLRYDSSQRQWMEVLS